MTDARRGWLDENIDASVVMRASNRGHSSAVEHRIADPAVAGSNPAGPFLFFLTKTRARPRAFASFHGVPWHRRRIC